MISCTGQYTSRDTKHLYENGFCVFCGAFDYDDHEVVHKQELTALRQEREAAGELLNTLQFKNIITFLKNAGLPTSAAWLAMKVGNLSVKEAIAYRNQCRISPSGDGGFVDMNKAALDGAGKE